MICLGYVQRFSDKRTGALLREIRSGELEVKGEVSAPLPRNMNEKIVWGGEDDNELFTTKLMIMQGRHHDMETLAQFGLLEEASRMTQIFQEKLKSEKSESAPLGKVVEENGASTTLHRTKSIGVI